MATRLVPSPQAEPQILDYGPSEQHFNEVIFTCHLCNESVKKSTFLSCLHSFCEVCIDERLQLVGTGTLQCPLCPSYENESTQLHTNPLPELINKLKHLKTALMDGTETIRCTDCVYGAEGKTAVAYCVECNATICQIDMRSHEKYSIGHLMLQLDTLQESSVKDILHSLRSSLEDSEKNSTIDYSRGSKYKLPEDHKSPFSERPYLPIQDECLLEVKSRISELEDRKSDLEKKWDNQVSQVVSFFQELYRKLETRQKALLEQLSQMYHTLMTPLQEAIHQLEQTVSYTGYVGVLSRYSQVAGISDRIGDRLMDISMFVTNYTAPTDPYSVNVDKQSERTIVTSMNSYLKLSEKSILPTKPIQFSFLPKNYTSIELDQKITLYIAPLDIAVNPITDTCYILFGTYWRTYQQFYKCFKEIQTIRITIPNSFPFNSSIALLNNSIIIMSNHILYVYSESGEVINQFQTQKQIGIHFDNPRIYTFTGINSIYLASLESPHVCKVNSQNGTDEGVINLTTQMKQVHHTNFVDFVDMVRSPTQVNQLLILYTTYPSNNPPQHNTTNNQYRINTYNIQTLQCIGVYSLSQPMSPFCCLTTVNDTLTVLDICTGYVHIYLFTEMNSNFIETNGRNEFYAEIKRSNKPNYKCIAWSRRSFSANSIPKCTDIEGKTLKDLTIRAFYDMNRKQTVLLSGGRIHFIS